MADLLSNLTIALSAQNLFFIVIGTVIGIVAGALPGFTPTMGIAIMIPITYTLNPATGLIFLGAIYCGAMYGGSISAILINTPGTSAAAATAIDGYKMTLNGRAHEALKEASVASFWGGIISVLALIFLAPPLAKFAFEFGPQERFMMALFGLTIIASLSTKSVLKGLIAGCVGLIFACVGMDPILGKSRFTFGSSFLMGGINIIPAVIGLFSISQIFTVLMDPIEKMDKDSIAHFKSAKVRLKDIVMYPIVYIRSAIIGIIIGIIPGTGGDVASYVSYNTGKMLSKDGDKFGTGSREGVACCEAANNAVTGGTLIPTLTLGVPGNTTTAVLLGGLTIHGLVPGYGLFTSQKPVTYPFIYALFLANLVILFIGLFGAKHFAMVTLTPGNILSGSVLMLSVVGSYAIRGNPNDVIVMLFFGLIGFLFKCYKYNSVPIVLGLILGPIAEEGLSQALLLNKNSLTQTLLSILTRPICLVLMLFMIISIIYPYLMERRSKLKLEQ